MDDSNNSSMRPNRRNVLKATGGTLAGLTSLLAADTVASFEPSTHRKFGRLTADNMCNELNNSLCDYVDTVERYSDDPDYDPYYCYSWYPDYVCDFLDTVDQSAAHYKNTEHDWGELGDSDEQAADDAAAAKSRVDGNDYVDAAIKTGRALHYIQDSGTLVHTGREYEQGKDKKIHYKFEDMVDDSWNSYFEGYADTTNGQDLVDSKSDVQTQTWDVAYTAHHRLEYNWDDIKDYGDYDWYTKYYQGRSITDSSEVSNGTVSWIWQNG